MQYLKDKLIYLSSPIEFGNCDIWKKEVKQLLKEFELNVFDPTEDSKQARAKELLEAREKEDYVTMTEISKAFVRKDLGMIDRCDAIVALIPKGVPTTGVVHEVINADNAKKPVMLLSDIHKKYIPLWYYGFIDHKYMFGNTQDLKMFLEQVNRGLINDRIWSFIYGTV